MSDQSDPRPVRSVTDPDGRTWEFHERPEVRKSEASDHLTLLIETPGEVRVVSCLISEWESETPDLIGLLARSVPAGASRSISQPRRRPTDEI